MRIRSFIDKYGKKIELEKINLFIGPNNVGKSQILKDIRDKMLDKSRNGIILESIEYELPHSYHEFIKEFAMNPHKQKLDTFTVEFIDSSLKNMEDFELHKSTIESFELDFSTRAKEIFESYFSKTRVAYLDASSRLELANSVTPVNPTKRKPNSILQMLVENPNETEFESELQDIFHKAFGMSIKIDETRQGIITFKVGKNNELKYAPLEQKLLKEYMKSYTMLEDQGDGFRSFVGIILSILLSKDKIILIDEPEAFLHPTQVRVLGNWIGNYLSKTSNQIIITTHSSHLLGSVLNNSEVKVLRLDREDNTTHFNQIASGTVNKISKNPLLSNFSILESLFYRGVILCEGDTDRIFYRSLINKVRDNNEEILFINTNGVGVMKKIIPLIKESNVPFKLILDFDLMLNNDELKSIVHLITDQSSEIISDFKNLLRNIYGKSEEELKMETLSKMKDLVSGPETHELTIFQLKKAIESISKMSKYSDIKRNGINAFDSNNKELIDGLITKLNKVGIFVVPVGELESWMNLGTSDKNEWIQAALSMDYEKDIPNNLKKFIKDLNNSFVQNKNP
jgi:predicted ATPase